MTIIAWDGKTLAADKLTSLGGLQRSMTKIYRVPQGLFGFCGNVSQGMELLDWFANQKCDIDKYPCFQATDDRCHAFIITNNRDIRVYENTPYPYTLENSQYACGSGRDFALAAMYLGQNAHDAALTACHFDINCGNGIDTLTF